VVRAFCPDCGGGIRVDPHVRLGQKLVCPHCDADLEVSGVEPLELDWADTWIEKDWDDVEDKEER
jgi:lysine biosynthesis protein LysW